MNILYISNEYPPETGNGGIGTYTKHSAEGMVSLDHCVHVICRSQSGEPNTTTQNGVVIHRIGPGTYPLPAHRALYPIRKCCYRHFPHSLQRMAWAREAYTTYEKLLRPIIKFDIIEYPECGNEGYYFSKIHDTARIVRLHTPWEIVRELDHIDESMFDRLALSYFERSAARRSTALTSPSRALAREMEKRWNVGTVTVFPNPLPVSNFSTAVGRDWIYTGRIELRKGVHILIKAYALVAQTAQPPPLHLIGKPYGKNDDGSDYGEYIERLIARLQCADLISWIRGVPADEIPLYLRQCAVAIFPSLWENMPYSCMEAMASGLAVVASGAGGYPELITDGVNGMLFEPRSAEALASHLSQLLAQPRLGKELGAKARMFAEKSFDSAVICRQMESFYRTIREGVIS